MKNDRQFIIDEIRRRRGLTNESSPKTASVKESNKFQLEPATSVSEDIKYLVDEAKKLPGYLGETTVSSAKHPGHATVGYGAGVASLLDTPQAAIELLDTIPKYAAEKVTGKKLPKNFEPASPLNLFNKAATKVGDVLDLESPGKSATRFVNALGDIIIGKPETQEEQQARVGGSIIGAFRDPKKFITDVAKVGSKTKEVVSNVNLLPKARAAANLRANIGEDVQKALKTKKEAEQLGIALKPGEATGNPLLMTEEASAGTSKEGALKLYKHEQKSLADQKKSIEGFLKDVHRDEGLVSEDLRKLSNNIIDSKIVARQQKAEPFYTKSSKTLIPEKELGKMYHDEPIIKRAIDDVLKDPDFASEIKGYAPNSIKILDLAKKQIDTKIKKFQNFGDNERVRVLNIAKDKLVKTLDKADPDYKKARSTYEENSPEIDKLYKNAIGKIARMSDEQLKNVSSTIFDPSNPDPLRIEKYRKEITKESPELWDALVRQDMESRIVQGEKSGRGFYNNILEDDRLFKQYEVALKHKPESLKKLRLMRNAFANLTKETVAKKTASKMELPVEKKGPVMHVWDLATGWARGKYDQAIVDLITSNKWDKELNKLVKSGAIKKDKLIDLDKLLESINENYLKAGKLGVVAKEGLEQNKIENKQNNAPAEDERQQIINEIRKRRSSKNQSTMPVMENNKKLEEKYPTLNVTGEYPAEDFGLTDEEMGKPAVKSIMNQKTLPGDKEAFNRIIMEMNNYA